MNSKQKDAFLEEMIGGAVRTEAAETIGIPVKDVRKELEQDIEFRRKVNEIEANAVEEALYQAAISGNIQACMKWIEIRNELKEKGGNRKAMPSEPPPFMSEEDKKQWKLLQKAKLKKGKTK